MNLAANKRDLFIADTSPASWRLGDIEIDEGHGLVRIAGKLIEMDRASYNLLLCLVHRGGDLVTKDELLREGWPGRVVTENSLTKAIGRLRQLVGDSDGELLRVVHGYGYRLATPVERVMPIEPLQPAGQETPTPAESLTRVAQNRRKWLRSGFLLAAIAILVALWFAWFAFRPRSADVATEKSQVSLAVLPFIDLSPDHDLGYFSDGLAEELLNDLSRLQQLRVAARTSSFALRKENIDARTIGAKLGVSTILEGSVRKSNDHVRVTVQLINTADGYHMWSQTYDRPSAELFAMQDEITRAIVDALRVELLPEQLKKLTQVGTTSVDAYQEYLLAVKVYRDDETEARRALTHLERAVELDPKFVDAWLALADLISHSGLYADNADQALAGKKRAMEIYDHVIELAPDRPETYFARAERKYAHWWDWQGARADIELGKTHPAANTDEYYLRSRCRLEAALGDLHTAIALARRETEVNPQSDWAWTVMGYHFTALGDFDHAREALTQALRVQPIDDHAHYYLGLDELLQGRPAVAIPHFNDSAQFLRLTGLAIAHHTLGDAAASEQDLQLLISRFGHVLPYQAAEVYAWRGEPDKAFEWLERSYQLHDASFMYLEFDPLLRNVHADPRFAALLARLKLPPLNASIAPSVGAAGVH